MAKKECKDGGRKGLGLDPDWWTSLGGTTQGSNAK